MGLPFDRLTIESRRKIAAEFDDLNSQLSFTLNERPASSGEGLALRAFDGEADRDIFAARNEDIGAAGDGSGAPIGSLDDEVRLARARIDAEEAVWFVAVAGTHKVGNGVRRTRQRRGECPDLDPPRSPEEGLWHSRIAQVAVRDGGCFPAVPMVVLVPGAIPG